eukprot:COSAG01_NODE_42224_length_442_cov_0.906706_1_plen_78_part_10
MLERRSACGCCEWEGMLVVAGGRGGAGEPLDSVHAFDGQPASQPASQPTSQPARALVSQSSQVMRPTAPPLPPPQLSA